jgi:hypothetical protein
VIYSQESPKMEEFFRDFDYKNKIYIVCFKTVILNQIQFQFLYIIYKQCWLLFT